MGEFYVSAFANCVTGTDDVFEGIQGLKQSGTHGEYFLGAFMSCTVDFVFSQGTGKDQLSFQLL